MRGDGKNDPRMPLYWELKGFTEEDAIKNAKLECRKCSPRCIEYWIKRGYSEEYGLEQIKKIQNNGKSLIGSKRTEEQKVLMKANQIKIHTLQHWIEKYGDDLGKKNYEIFKQKQIENGKLSSIGRLKSNPNTYLESTQRRPEYWIKRGYSEEDAKLMVSKSQSRGIDFYIKKYGFDLGTKKWKERNEKWFNSFYNSGKDLQAVNEKRKLNSHVGYYTEETISNIDELYFYMILLQDKNCTFIIKYGLTKQDVISKRWSVSLNYKVVIFKKMDAKIALQIEQKFHKHFKSSYVPSIIKTTECFQYTDINLNTAIKIIEDFEND